MSEESPLATLQKQIRERMREGMARVERLEDATSARDLEKWMDAETKRYGGRRVELEDD